jgi:diphosphomevalonate decarboxylase
MEQKEYVILVDLEDNETGKEEKIKAHKKGLLHRAFSVFLFRRKNNNIQLLLQQREKNKYHCGGLWANTCCSHPRSGEFLIDAGKRRLKEEMGIQLKTSLTDVGSFHYKAAFDNGLMEHEVDHVLIGTFNSDSIPFNPQEVETARWVPLDELANEYQQNPGRFTPWFLQAFTLARQNITKLAL